MMQNYYCHQKRGRLHDPRQRTSLGPEKENGDFPQGQLIRKNASVTIFVPYG